MATTKTQPYAPTPVDELDSSCIVLLTEEDDDDVVTHVGPAPKAARNTNGRLAVRPLPRPATERHH